MGQIKIGVVGNAEAVSRVLNSLKSGFSSNGKVGVYTNKTNTPNLSNVKKFGEEAIVIYHSVVNPAQSVQTQVPDKVIYVDVHPLDETQEEKAVKEWVIKHYNPEAILFIQYPRKQEKFMTPHDHLWRKGPTGEYSPIYKFVMDCLRHPDEVAPSRAYGASHSSIRVVGRRQLPS